MPIIQMTTYRINTPGPTPILPAEYQEVERVGSNGTPYINTGMKFTNNTKIDLDVAFTANRSGWSSLMGAMTINSHDSWAIGLNSNTFTYQLGTNHSIDFSWTPTLNQLYNIKNDDNYIYIDDVLKGIITMGSYTTFTTAVNGTIFKANYQTSTGFAYNASASIYECKIYDKVDNVLTLVRDYIPCYRKADSVIGMYDIVNDTFYTNAGGGTFTKGPDVN